MWFTLSNDEGIQFQLTFLDHIAQGTGSTNWLKIDQVIAIVVN